MCVCVFVVAKYVSWTTGKERAVSLVPAVAGSVAEFHQLHLSRYNTIYTHTHTLTVQWEISRNTTLRISLFEDQQLCTPRKPVGTLYIYTAIQTLL